MKKYRIKTLLTLLMISLVLIGTFTINYQRVIAEGEGTVQVTFDPVDGRFSDGPDGDEWFENCPVGETVFEGKLPPEPVKANYRFAGWFDANDVQFTGETRVFENMTVSARWIEVLTVTFHADIDAFVNDDPKQMSFTYDKGSVLNKYPSLRKLENYEFKGWQYENGTEFIAGTTVNENFDLYAVFETVEVAPNDIAVSQSGNDINITSSNTAWLQALAKGREMNVSGSEIISETIYSNIYLSGTNYYFLQNEHYYENGNEKTSYVVYSYNNGKVVIPETTIDEYEILSGSYTFEFHVDGYSDATVTATIDTDTELAPSDINVVFDSTKGLIISTTNSAYLNALASGNLSVNTDPMGGYQIGLSGKGSIKDNSYILSVQELAEENVVTGDYIIGLRAEGYNVVWYDNKNRVHIEIPATTFTVSFDTDGGTAVSSQTCGYLETVEKPADPLKKGYTFNSWWLVDSTDGSSLIKEYDFDEPVTENITIKATYDENTYSIFYDIDLLDEIISGEVERSYRKYSEEFVLPTTTNYQIKGHTFAYWTDKQGNKVEVIPAYSEATKVYAKWIENEYKVFYDANGGTGNMDYETRLYTQSKVLATNEFTYKGHEFVCWLDEENQPISQIPERTDKDVTVKANWVEKDYTVKTHVDDTVIEFTVKKGYSLSETEGYNDPVKDNYSFVGWNTEADGSGTTFLTTEAINSDLEIYAQFVKIEIKESEIDNYQDDADKQEVANVSENTKAEESVLAVATSQIEIPDAVSGKLTDNEVLADLGVSSSENVELVIETHLKMEIKDVSKEEGSINSFVIDITPLYTIKAKVKGDNTTEPVPLMKDNNGEIRYEELHVKEETTMKIYLPESFSESGTVVWVKHKNTVFGGDNGIPVSHDNNGYYVEYIDPNGFSPFEISKNRLYPDPEVNPSPSDSSDNKVRLPKTGIE